MKILLESHSAVFPHYLNDSQFTNATSRGSATQASCCVQPPVDENYENDLKNLKFRLGLIFFFITSNEMKLAFCESL